MIEEIPVKRSTNPYVIDGEAPTLKLSAFVFMDILGYADLIRRAEKDDEQQTSGYSSSFGARPSMAEPARRYAVWRERLVCI